MVDWGCLPSSRSSGTVKRGRRQGRTHVPGKNVGPCAYGGNPCCSVGDAALSVDPHHQCATLPWACVQHPFQGGLGHYAWATIFQSLPPSSAVLHPQVPRFSPVPELNNLSLFSAFMDSWICQLSFSCSSGMMKPWIQPFLHISTQ